MDFNGVEQLIGHLNGPILPVQTWAAATANRLVLIVWA